MPKPILSPRSRIPLEKADALLKGYAERMPPAEAAERTGLSLNTVYEQYARIRWRLIETGYYTDAALSKSEAGLSEPAMEQLRLRRGLADEDIYAHAAEVIAWAEEWPPDLVLRQLRKIIELTGPIDRPLDLSKLQAGVVRSYVTYARVQLILDRVTKEAEADPSRNDFRERVRAASDSYWKDYRTAARRLSRHENSARNRRRKDLP